MTAQINDAWRGTTWRTIPECRCAVKLVPHPDGPIMYLIRTKRRNSTPCRSLHRDAFPRTLWEQL